MEWVETTGRSVQEAKEAALDELGVDEADAEFEIVAEAQTGLFGRLRSEARVRARVRPTAPRAKEDRRERRRRSGSGSPASGTPASGTPASGTSGPGSVTSGSSTEAESDSDSDPGASDSHAAAPNGPSNAGAKRRRNRSRGGKHPASGGPSPARMAELDQSGEGTQNASRARRGADDVDESKGPKVEVAMERQAEVATEFLTQLTTEFGLSATVSVVQPEEDTVELQLSGSDLGILIGPKGATLLAIQNLTRTVVFNQTGGSNGHINVDVGGYRQKRSEALARFATQVADKVKETGERTVLEPMSAIDRKVVHDTISAIDGVSTVSEGEEPRRRVVVLPG